LKTNRRRGAATTIAETFTRPERTDRTYAQTILDETLIAKMDLEYNDDDIGSLEGCEEATRGPALHDGNSLMEHVLDDYRKNYRKGRMVVRALPYLCMNFHSCFARFAAECDKWQRTCSVS
jgi:hypothetical protein